MMYEGKIDKGYYDICVGDVRNGKWYTLGKPVEIGGKEYKVSGIYKDVNSYLEDGVSRYTVYVVDGEGGEFPYKDIEDQPVIATHKL